MKTTGKQLENDDEWKTNGPFPGLQKIKLFSKKQKTSKQICHLKDLQTVFLKFLKREERDMNIGLLIGKQPVPGVGEEIKNKTSE